jgi:replicative DNA helicase
MEFGIGIIEVAQFNREGAKSGKPTMHDLEASSQLEKDTSLIFILDREKPDEQRYPADRERTEYKRMRDQRNIRGLQTDVSILANTKRPASR